MHHGRGSVAPWCCGDRPCGLAFAGFRAPFVGLTRYDIICECRFVFVSAGDRRWVCL